MTLTSALRSRAGVCGVVDKAPGSSRSAFVVASSAKPCCDHHRNAALHNTNNLLFQEIGGPKVWWMSLLE